ncbi:hypothetical protein [Oryza sativa Japonica Group]|uniref:Uncharacterized protein n=2 Tax=Oryza sativa subsp. japonica TaxID=39947 RepID=Q5VPZ5_ORYSJ|nr:hypothetical protein [Oryza sativa Japonica Group]BAD68922.1 hypothetical protein [Oryza sativa Japonica Group]
MLALGGHVPELAQRVEVSSKTLWRQEGGRRARCAKRGACGGTRPVPTACHMTAPSTTSERLSTMGKPMELGRNQKKGKEDKGKIVIICNFSLINWVDIIF